MSRPEFLMAGDPNLQAKDPTNPKKKDPSVITVDYVNQFTDGVTLAESYSEAIGALFPNVVFISADRNYGTLAHEVFHVIENLPLTKADFTAGVDPLHYPYTQQAGAFSGIDTANLMVVGGKGTHRPKVPTALDSVRLDQKQQDRAYADAALVKNPT
jgi:hypothetical protein